MESAERLLSQLRCGNIVGEYSFSMAILDCPPLTIQWSISNNDAIKYIESRDAAIRAECVYKAVEYIAKHGFAHVSQNVDLFCAAIMGGETDEV